MVMMGAGLLWVGWFGFNAGKLDVPRPATAQALAATQAAAAAGAACAWLLIEAFRTGKPSAWVLLAGNLRLVAVTLAAGVALPSQSGAMAVWP